LWVRWWTFGFLRHGDKIIKLHIIFICSLLSMFFQELKIRMYNVEWKDDRWMMNWKGYGRKRLCPNLRYYLAFAYRNWENQKNPQSTYPVSGTRFEPGILQIRSRIVNHDVLY
jgi:hypothetical protein